MTGKYRSLNYYVRYIFSPHQICFVQITSAAIRVTSTALKKKKLFATDYCIFKIYSRVLIGLMHRLHIWCRNKLLYIFIGPPDVTSVCNICRFRNERIIILHSSTNI